MSIFLRNSHIWPAESKRGFDSLHPLQSSQSPIKSRVCCMLPVFKKAQLLTHTANGLPGVRWCLKGCKTLFRDARGRGSRTSGARLGGPPGRRGDRLWAGPGSSLASRCGSGAGRVRPGPRVRSARGGCRFNWRISPVGWLGVGLLEGPPYRTVPGRAWGCRAGRGLAPRGAARGGVSANQLHKFCT